MTKRKAIIIAGEVFNLKKDLVSRVQAIIRSHKDHEMLGWFDLRFMTDLLKCHPQAKIKLGCGIDGMYVAENPIYPGKQSRGFRLIRTDGSETDFSYRECITPTSYKRKVKAAFRVAIESQALQFKQEYFDSTPAGWATCPDTGEFLSFVNSHVDHVAPLTFEHLLNHFLERESLTLEQVRINDFGQDNCYQDTLTDGTLKKRWMEYHQSHAVLEVVSKHANLSTRKRKARCR
jgi:hypothetical protein